MIYDAVELFSKLEEEDCDEYFYRGQTKEFPSPLWPSAYRPFTRYQDPVTIPEDYLLRNTGGQFYYKTGLIFNPGLPTEREFKQYARDVKLLDYMKALIRNAFGYPLSEAFFQQIGFKSEGLDVTRSLTAALFFASYELNEDQYIPKTNTEPGVIYRWRIRRKSWTMQDLNAYNYETCPVFIPTKDILMLFEPCDNVEECLDSLDEYREQIFWNYHHFDLDAIQGNRPFETIKIPQHSYARSRVINQDAYIILPDASQSVDSSREYLANLLGKNTDEILPGIFVSDQSAYCECEKFLFSPNRAGQIEEIKNFSPGRLFSRNDILFWILREWLKTFFRNLSGAPLFIIDKTFLNLGMDTREFLDQVANNIEEKYFL